MLELWLSGKQWPLGLPRLREPAARLRRALADRGVQFKPAELAERRRCGGADSARLGHLSSLSLTQTSLLQLSSIAIGLTQRAGTSGERRAHWLRGARRSCSDYHISASQPRCATDRSASPRERPAAPPAPSPPVALLLRPALLGSPQSGWPRCARGSLFRLRWRVAGGSWAVQLKATTNARNPAKHPRTHPSSRETRSELSVADQMTFFLKEVTPFSPLQSCRTGSSEFSAKGLISKSVLEVYWEGEEEGRRRYLVGGQEEEEEQQKITRSAREGVGGQEIYPGSLK
ncbi:unnamed protein product [Rangifer tarandus platyrhynchus]|uniref:Uncharacterized protein n=2 Tax=Rangifer tarandus platyrhynchus TaxID=3082113 RepID=A0ACB0E537_RANTA|nr:unnamed protein product [Rangifer tarandus platyrhynchus]CAI9695740.1 unnamed protein product [Rangifer tarandus platyrhynchus]